MLPYWRADHFLMQVGKPSMVLLLECETAVAEKRFVSRSRETGDDKEMFAKRCAEFLENNKLIMRRYSALARIVSQQVIRRVEQSLT